MKHLKTIFACLLMAVLSIGQVWATDVTSKMDLDDQSPAYTANTTSYTGTQSATWSLSKTCASQSVGSESSANNDKYYQIGSGSKNATSMTWSSSSFNGKRIKQVIVKCSSSASATGTNKATVTVTATGGTFSPATSGSNILSGSTYTTVTFNSSASGGDQISGNLTVNIAFSSQQQKNIRLYQIDVIYANDDTPSCTEPTTALSITNANTATIGTPLTLTSTGGNGGTIIWSVAAGTGTASVSGNVLTPLTKGTVTVTATQAENDGKCGAAPTQEITISKAAPAPIAGTVVDELTSSTFASTGSYTAFSGKQAANEGHSSAVYAGKTSRNGNSTKYNVQLNTITSTGNPAGSAISTTTSGGLAKRVYVTWATQSTNTNNRKLTVYGKNDAAYTGTETATAGTEIGDIVYATGDTYEYLDITGDYQYIQIVASGAIYMDQIDVYWLPIKSAITIDDDVENGSVGVSGIANLSEVAAGTEVTLTNTPASGYKLTAYDVYKTGASATKVTVTNGKFTMPAYGVTVSATFEATKTLTGIALTGEYPTVFLTGDAFSHTGMTVTANYDDNSSADVTSSASFTGYNMNNAGAQTVTVSYTEGTTESQTYGITVKDAYTVTEILPLVPATGSMATRVKGYISQIDSYDSNHNSITYWITDDGKTTSDKLEVYSGKNVGNTNFSAITDLEVGDFVTISGNVKTFGTVKEFDYNNYIITGGRIQKGDVTNVVVSGTPSKTTPYTSSESTFDPTGLVVTATYENGFSGVVTEGITWGDDLTNHEVTASGTVNVTATVGGVTSDSYAVSVEFSGKTLSSIAAGTASYTIYTGEALPRPTITATYSEGDPADVKDDANTVFDTESVFDTDTPDDYTITVSYTFSGETKTTTYTVTVVDYANDAAHPYTPEQARYITINAVGSTKATKDIYVQGKVSQLGGSISSGKWGYYISADGTTANQFQIYNGYYLNGAQFTNATKLHLNDEVIVKGKVIYYNGETPEFAAGESQLESLARTPNFSITDVAEFEVGAADLAVEDLTITVEGEGAITLSIAPEDAAKATIVNNAIHAVGAGTVTVTASLAADGIYKAASTTFDVTVIAGTTKYTVAFDENGADGGTDPTAIANQAEGASVTLPTNTWTKTNKIFDGWKVFNNSTTEEISYTGNSFTMPASAVTIQAQWADLSEWATTYTSNITVGTDVVKFSDELEAPTFAAKKTGTGSNYGSTTVIVPVSTSKLHFHAVCYGADTYAVTLKVKNGESVLGTFNIDKDAGAKGSSEFTLANTPYEQYYFVNLTGITEPTTITFEAESGDDKGKRFIIFGVNQEGGLVPVLDRIVVTGDAESKAYDAGDRFDKYNYAGLGANAIYKLGGVDQTPVAIDFADIEWSSDPEIVQASTAKVTVTATYEGKSATKDITDLSITVTEPEITTDKATLEFGTYDQTANVADKEFYVTLKNVANASLEITGTGASAFAIDNTALTQSGTITVSASTATAGSFNAKVRITDNAGVAEAVEVSLHITVNAAEAQANKNLEWVEATEVFDGMQVVFTGVKSSTTYAMSSQASNNRTTAAFEDATTPGDGSVVFTLVAQGNGTYAIKTSLGEYLYAASNSANHLKTRANIGDDGKAVWTITIGEENVASIAANCETANWRNVMQFNQNGGNPPVFACYATASQSAIKLYTPKYYHRGVTVDRMGTVCVDHNVPAGNIQGAEVYKLLYWKYGTSYADCQMVDFEEVTEMEAGKPYLIIPTAENIRLVYGETSVGAPVAYSGFIGTFADIAASETNVLVGMYGIVNNMIQKLGENCSSKANRAYIDLSQTPSKEEYEASHPSSPAPSRRISLSHQAEEVTTDLDALQVNTEKVEKVMIEGQLFILRGGHVYDATGRLVK